MIAEGVETKEELELLHNNGYEEIQGDLLGKPLLPDNAKTLMLNVN